MHAHTALVYLEIDGLQQRYSFLVQTRVNVPDRRPATDNET